MRLSLWFLLVFVLLLMVPLTVSALAPVADFTTSSPCYDISCQLLDTSENTPTSGNWTLSFGEYGGHSENLETEYFTNYYYPAPIGLWSVTHCVSNDDGSDCIQHDIDIIQYINPITIISFNPTSGYSCTDTNCVTEITITGENLTLENPDYAYLDDSSYSDNFTELTSTEIKIGWDLHNSGGSYQIGLYYPSYGSIYSPQNFEILQLEEPTPTPTETTIEPTPTETLSVIICENQIGNIAINLSERTTTSLKWVWEDPTSITKISQDGLYILNFDNSSESYTGTGYTPASWHHLKIYNDTDFGQLICRTDDIVHPGIPIMPSTEQNFSLLGYWWIPAVLIALWLLFRRK